MSEHIHPLTAFNPDWSTTQLDKALFNTRPAIGLIRIIVDTEIQEVRLATEDEDATIVLCAAPSDALSRLEFRDFINLDQLPEALTSAELDPFADVSVRPVYAYPSMDGKRNLHVMEDYRILRTSLRSTHVAVTSLLFSIKRQLDAADLGEVYYQPETVMGDVADEEVTA